ncbi:MAG: hypothetical protein EU529_09330 [Promethearchaeota archaeon]|nr:MAG: hypothetical protein EU529_09330 [Candidatus Lokiarchaeota archaeon]
MKFEYNLYRTFLINIIVYFLILLIPTLDFLILILIFGISVINVLIIISVIIFQISMGVFMIPFIVEYFKNNLPILKIAFIITEEQFQLTFFERIYLNFFWKDLKKIEMFYEDLFDFKKYYKLKIQKNDNTIEEITLSLLAIKKKTLKEIIHELKSCSKNSTVPFVELKEVEKGISKERHLEFNKMKNFIKNI